MSFALLFVLANQAWAQGFTVTGTVTDQKNTPLPGVGVAVKGTTVGTFTNANGTFSIGAPSGEAVLIIKFLGYTTQEVKVGGRNTINVQLAEDTKSLSEVVVTGYGTTTKLEQTGSVVQVGAKDIENTQFTSVDKALQGRVAGLMSIAGSGQPGAAQQVRIRGVGSMTASSEPLYVVDGVPINSGDLSRIQQTSNALAGINPNDIESMTVLKDASAASIYGSRAANGVIVITTKSGKAGKTKFRFDMERGYSEPGYLNKRNRPLTTEEYRELTAEGRVNAGSSQTLEQALAYVDNTMITAARAGVSTNWLDEVTQVGVQQQYNLSASGGNDKTQFHIGAGYFEQEGSVINSYFERYSTNVNLKHKATERLSFNTNMMISYSSQKGETNGGTFRNPILAAYFLTPYLPAYNAEGKPSYSATDFSGIYNPLAVAEYDSRIYGALKGIGSASAEYRILDNLKFTSKFGVDYNGIEEDLYYNPYFGDARNSSGQSYRYYTRYFNWVATNLLDYNLDILNDNSLVANLKAGYEAQKSLYYSSNVSTTNLPPNTDITVPSAGSVLNTASGTNEGYTFTGLLAIGDISYKGRYVLSGSFRRDGSSRFSINNPYGNFWSVGAAWNVDQEPFMQSVPVVSQLKLRGSYGLNGNASIGNYAWRPTYGYGATYNYNGLSGSAPSNVGNENLTWETNKPLDLGFDLGLFNNRLNVVFDWYSRKTTGLLMEQPISHTSGFPNFTNNVGAMKNSGIELELSGTPVAFGDFRWDARFNISTNKNEVLNLVDGDIISSPFIRRVGENYYSFYVRQWAGVDPANGNPLWYTDETRTETTSIYNDAERVIVGQSTPKYFGGVGSTFSFKGFSLDFLFYYSGGNLVRDSWASYTQGDGYNSSFNKVASQLDRWQKPGDITNVPKYVVGGNLSSNSLSDRFLYQGDYVRLRDLTLAYNLPSTLLEKIHMTSLRVYLSGTNLATWVKDKDLPYDPETYVTSSNNFDAYIPKTYTLGINVGF